jgi:AraC family transcriptional regulator
MLQPRFETLPEKKLIGKKMIMSVANDKTSALFGSFMPKRREIRHTVNADVYCLKVFDPSHFSDFNPNREFEKWALTEVTGFENIPHEMESFVLPGGLYAVFAYKGLSTDMSIFNYIYATWLPDSGYVLDHRPHFDVLGEKYKNNDPDSEEDIWIPVKPK